MKDLKTPKKDVKNWKLRSDSPGTNLSKNQHFADFLYKFAVLEDHKRMGSSLFVLPGKAVAHPFSFVKGLVMVPGCVRIVISDQNDIDHRIVVLVQKHLHLSISI